MTVLSKAEVRLSRRLSMVLRHRPESAGITLDANGWVPVDQVLAALHITRAVFHRSDNGAWQTAAVPPRYLS